MSDAYSYIPCRLNIRVRTVMQMILVLDVLHGISRILRLSILLILLHMSPAIQLLEADGGGGFCKLRLELE